MVISNPQGVELKETAFNMWMACYSAQEIADEIGYSKAAVVEFTNFLQSVRNAGSFVSDRLSENFQLAELPDLQEFDGEDEEDSNSLGTYNLDKRILIKANHLDDTYKPPMTSRPLAYFSSRRIVGDETLYSFAILSAVPLLLQSKTN